MISGLLDPDMLIVPNINVTKPNTHVRLGLEVKKKLRFSNEGRFCSEQNTQRRDYLWRF